MSNYRGIAIGMLQIVALCAGTETRGAYWDQYAWDQYAWDQYAWDQYAWDQYAWDQYAWDQYAWDHEAMVGLVARSSTLEARIELLEAGQRYWGPFWRQCINKEHESRIEVLEKNFEVLQEESRSQKRTLELIGREQAQIADDIYAVVDKLCEQLENRIHLEILSVEKQLQLLREGCQGRR